MLKLHAPAKINLFLRILAQERSGFHQLETLFATLEFGDTLTLGRTPSGISLETDGPPVGPPEANLAYRAAAVFLAAGGIREGVRIRLEKRIPVAAGLGGGSSDAAATLRGLQSLFPGALGEEQLLELAGGLGSDVPPFLSPSPLNLAWGRGTRLLPLPPPPPAPVLLALPSLGMGTAEAYALLAQERARMPKAPPPAMHSFETLSQWEGIWSLARNDFENIVFGAHPFLARIRGALQESGAMVALLSGSGAALFGLYRDDDAATSARDDLSHLFPDTRFQLTQTRARPPQPQEAPGG
jgi:4-diphosphocytidyl-2-C-methyl-D-erythritol kinase